MQATADNISLRCPAYETKNTPVQLSWPFGNLKNGHLAIKNPDMIYLLTNVRKTQDVPLDGTIFSGNTGRKDRATFMNKNIPIHWGTQQQFSEKYLFGRRFEI